MSTEQVIFSVVFTCIITGVLFITGVMTGKKITEMAYNSIKKPDITSYVRVMKQPSGKGPYDMELLEPTREQYGIKSYDFTDEAGYFYRVEVSAMVR